MSKIKRRSAVIEQEIVSMSLFHFLLLVASNKVCRCVTTLFAHSNVRRWTSFGLITVDCLDLQVVYSVAGEV